MPRVSGSRTSSRICTVSPRFSTIGGSVTPSWATGTPSPESDTRATMTTGRRLRMEASPPAV